MVDDLLTCQCCFCMESCGLNYYHIYNVVKHISLCKLVDVYAYLNRSFMV